MSVLVKTVDVPQDVRKPLGAGNVAPFKVEFYDDKLTARVERGVLEWPITEYSLAKVCPASKSGGSYAVVVLLKPEEESLSVAKMFDVLKIINTRKFLAFGGGLFSKKASDEFAIQLTNEINNWIKEYREAAIKKEEELRQEKLKRQAEEEQKMNDMVYQALGQSIKSPAEQIKEFKELLDMNVITQEEFEAKKKQLLGL